MRVNTPSLISDQTHEFIKNIKMQECKDCRPYFPDLNPIEMFRR